MINTSGHQVSVMPQYTPADPNLLAANPANMLQGALQAIQMQGALAELKAFQRDQAEKAALAGLRVNASASGYRESAARSENSMRVLPSAGEAAIAQNTANARTAGPQADFDLAKIGAGLRMVGPQADAAIAQAKATTQTAPALADLATKKATSEGKDVDNKERLRGVTENTQALQAALAEETASFALDLLPAEQAKVSSELYESLKNAKNDAQLKRAYTTAQIKLLNAQADKFNAEADGTGRFSNDTFARYAKMETIENQMANKERAIFNTEVTLPDGSIGKLSDYIAATREVGGAAKKKGMLFWKSDVERNPEAEQLIKDLLDLKMTEVDLMGQEAPIKQVGESQEAKEALEWIKANPNDPRVPKIKAKLGIQ
jgi:hypothetical protein